MVEGDSLEAARAIACGMTDPRVQHFFDTDKRAGKAIASSLGGEGKIAWDIYTFFPKGCRWARCLPTPQFWMHQLTQSTWADAAHQNCGDDLIRELGNCMKALGFCSGIDADQQT